VITPHTGPANFVLRYHLGLVIPEDRDNCWIKLDDEKYSWKEGEDLLFDDTFTHEVTGYFLIFRYNQGVYIVF
jgi:aspartyl/asparaginyl beta-hydroxylase (cupin superfamily)